MPPKVNFAPLAQAHRASTPAAPTAKPSSFGPWPSGRSGQSGPVAVKKLT